MQIFNSALVRVPAGLVLRGGGRRLVDISVRYGIIAGAHLALVDTGYGPHVTLGPRTRALRLYAGLLRPKLVASGLPQAVLGRLGATPADVETIVVTHLHADHVAALRDFPKARFLASRAANAAAASLTPAAAIRHGIFLELLPPDFVERATAIETFPRVETGTVLGAGFALFGPPDILAIPLPGHAIGHFGLFWRDVGGPVLYATDVTWSGAALAANKTPALSRAFVFEDRRAGAATEARIRAFSLAGGTVHICHDILEAP